MCMSCCFINGAFIDNSICCWLLSADYNHVLRTRGTGAVLVDLVDELNHAYNLLAAKEEGMRPLCGGLA